MKIINQYWQYVDSGESISDMKKIEYCGRTCYDSCDKSTNDSYKDFITKIIKSGHESVLEHASLSVEIVTDRAVMAELTRHRLASFSIQSQRYVKYKEVTFILPVWFTDLYDKVKDDDDLTLSEMPEDWKIWVRSCWQAEEDYHALLNLGHTPQQARVVLTNSAATTIIITANVREWRHIFNLRCSDKAYPQIRYLCKDMLYEFTEDYPYLFGDIAQKYGVYQEPNTVRKIE